MADRCFTIKSVDPPPLGLLCLFNSLLFPSSSPSSSELPYATAVSHATQLPTLHSPLEPLPELAPARPIRQATYTRRRCRFDDSSHLPTSVASSHRCGDCCPLRHVDFPAVSPWLIPSLTQISLCCDGRCAMWNLRSMSKLNKGAEPCFGELDRPTHSSRATVRVLRHQTS